MHKETYQVPEITVKIKTEELFPDQVLRQLLRKELNQAEAEVLIRETLILPEITTEEYNKIKYYY